VARKAGSDCQAEKEKTEKPSPESIRRVRAIADEFINSANAALGKERVEEPKDIAARFMAEHGLTKAQWQQITERRNL
jgi:hypothetical protein